MKKLLNPDEIPMRMVQAVFPKTPSEGAYRQRTVVLLDTAKSDASKGLAGMLRETGLDVRSYHELYDALDYIKEINDEHPVLFAANEDHFPYERYRGGINALELAQRGSRTVDGVLLVHEKKFNTQTLRRHMGKRTSSDIVVPLYEVPIESAANILRQLATTGQSLDYKMLFGGDLVRLN